MYNEKFLKGEYSRNKPQVMKRLSFFLKQRGVARDEVAAYLGRHTEQQKIARWLRGSLPFKETRKMAHSVHLYQSELITGKPRELPEEEGIEFRIERLVVNYCRSAPEAREIIDTLAEHCGDTAQSIVW